MTSYLPPSKLQIELINTITAILWLNTNDFSSPTRFVDIREELNKFKYDGLSDEYVDGLIELVDKLLKEIKNVDRNIIDPIQD